MNEEQLSVKTLLYGLYQHYKGGLYLVTGFSWESTNGRDRERVVEYVSLVKCQKNSRTEFEFHQTVNRITGKVVPADAPPPFGVGPRFRLLRADEVEKLERALL